MKIKISENISDNIKCNWTIIKKNSLQKYNIISVCFFFIKNKVNNDKYINGIIHVIENFQLFKTFLLRIYFDTSVKKILFDILNNIDIHIINKIELFQYDIPLMKDGNYHQGYIGTLIRFMPLFNTLIHKTDKCIVLDIDNTITNIYNEIIDYSFLKNISICYRSRYGYSLKDRLLCLKDEIIIDYPIIASFIYKSGIEIPYFLLSDFLETIYFKNNYNLLSECKIGKYDYGVDEIFINKYFLNYIYNNNIQFSPIIFNYYQIYGLLSNYLSLIKDNEELNYYTKFLNIFFKLLKINIKININSYTKLKNLKYKINTIIKNNQIIIKDKINNLLVDNNNLIRVKNVLMKLYKNKYTTNFNLFIKFILQNLDNVKNDKILVVKIYKNNLKKNYLPVNL